MIKLAIQEWDWSLVFRKAFYQEKQAFAHFQKDSSFLILTRELTLSSSSSNSLGKEKVNKKKGSGTIYLTWFFLNHGITFFFFYQFQLMKEYSMHTEHVECAAHTTSWLKHVTHFTASVLWLCLGKQQTGTDSLTWPPATPVWNMTGVLIPGFGLNKL